MKVHGLVKSGCAALLLLAGCIAGADKQQEMRDENLYHDLAQGAQERTGAEEDPVEMGGRLRDWQEEFDTAEAITLADCFRLALNNNEQLLIQGELLFESWTFEREAISELLPSIQYNWSWDYFNDEVGFGGEIFQPQQATDSFFTLKQKLFDGRAFAALPATKAARKIEQMKLKDQRDRLLYTVAAGFYEILGLEYDVRVFEASLASTEEFYRVVEARWKSGEASRQEVMSAKAERDAFSASLIESQHNVRIARNELARLVCLQALPDRLSDTYDVEYVPGDIPQLVEHAIVARPDVEARRQDIEFAKAARLADYSEYLPLVTGRGTYWLRQEGLFSDLIDWSVGVDLSWELFNSGAREARISRGESNVRRRELNLAQLERQVRTEVVDAVLSFESLGRVMGALESRAEASQSSMELAEIEYRADEKTNLDVQAARRVWEEAVRDLNRARLAHKLSALRIQLVTGDFNLSEPLTEAVDML